MTTLHRPLRLLLLATIAVGGLTFLAAFVAIFSGDPQFAGPLEVSPEEMARFAERYKQPYASETRHFTMSDGVKLASQYFPSQSQTTIVLVHGLMGSSFELNRCSGMLREATSAEVVAIDLRGHGASEGMPGDVDYIGQYEDDVGEVVGQLRAEKPGRHIVLAGHSMGGGIALRYADKPGLPAIDRMLLLAPYLGPTAPTTRLEETEQSANFMKVHIPRILGLELLNWFGITSFNGLRTMFFNLPPEVPLTSYSYRASATMAPVDFGAALEALRQPLLVLVGTKDEAFKADLYESTLRPHTRGELRLIEGASHDGVLTDERSLSKIRDWIGKGV